MILLTGASGFLGSYILLELLEKGHDVVALNRTKTPSAQIDRVFRTYSSSSEDLLSKVKWVEGDILDVFSLLDAMDGIDQVIHCAGMVSFDPGQEKALNEINTGGTMNMVNAALQMKISRFVYISSIAAIGRGQDDQVITEKTQWKNSRLNSKYAISKYGGEREVWRASEEGLDVAVLNPSILLGYGDPMQSTARMFDTVQKGLKFYPTGTNGFVGVRDTARAAELLLQENVRGERYILSAETLSYRQLFTMMAAELDKTGPSVPVGPALGGLAWRTEWLKSRILGAKPLITRETAQTSVQQYNYDGSRITRDLHFQYTPVREVLAETKKLLYR